MVVEVGVLGRDGGLDEERRDLAQRDDGAPAGVGVEGLVEQVAVPVVDPGAAERGAARRQLLGGREGRGEVHVARHGRAGRHDGEAEHDEHGRAERRPAKRPGGTGHQADGCVGG
ncbi:MAG: hypothetical protein DYG90_13015, partial [Chloroflexi bacterium CFX6]|nr:hypothetical protein [Chloroflexi bacterium CFX6]